MSQLNIIRQAFAAVLGRADVAADRSFFDLGGTSLQAAQILIALRGHKGFEVLTIADIFRNDTPKKLSNLAATHQITKCDDQPALGSFAQGAASGPLSVQQHAIWFAEQMLPGNFAYNTTSYVRLPEPLDQTALGDALQNLLIRHPILTANLVIGPDGPEIETGAHPAPDLLVESCAPDQLDQKLLDEGQICYDVMCDPLIKWRCYTLPDGSAVLAQFEHHFVHDGWSMWRLWHDLATSYQAALSGSEPNLPEVQGHYTDYCHWQKEWLASSAAQAGLLNRAADLANHPYVLRFDGDDRRPAQFTHTGNTTHVTLPKDLANQLRRYASAQHLTPFSVLFGAFLLFLHGQCKIDDLVIGSMMRHRNLPGFETTVGMFVNTLALGFNDIGRSSFTDLCRSTQDKLQEAQATEHLPFPLVAQRIDFTRDLTRNGLFQVCFSMNDYPDQRPDFGPGMSVPVQFPSNGGAKFDLDVVLTDPEDFSFLWRYYDGLFTAERISGLIAEFHQVLSDAIGS